MTLYNLVAWWVVSHDLDVNAASNILMLARSAARPVEEKPNKPTTSKLLSTV